MMVIAAPFCSQSEKGSPSIRHRCTLDSLSKHKVFKTDHSLCIGFEGLSLRTMKRKLSPKQVLAVRCPTCGASPGKKCELSTGQPRTEPHRDRRMFAADEAARL